LDTQAAIPVVKKLHEMPTSCSAAVLICFANPMAGVMIIYEEWQLS
jgi:hypothetical protein